MLHNESPQVRISDYVILKDFSPEGSGAYRHDRRKCTSAKRQMLRKLSMTPYDSTLLRAHPILPVGPHEPDDARGQHEADHEVKLMEVLAQPAPVFAQLHAQVRQCETPRPRSQKRVEVKTPARHTGNAGRQS